MNNSTIGAMVSMSALQQRMDLIAENIANLNTAGYKSKDGSFEDALTRVQGQSREYHQPGRSTPLGYNLGFGIRVPSVTIDWSEGPLMETGGPTDLALQGNGLFGVQVNGGTAYTRLGAFHYEPDPEPIEPGGGAQMRLVDNMRNPVLNTAGEIVRVPVGTIAAIDETGQMWTKTSETGEATPGQRLMIVQPLSKESLKAVDGGFFVLAEGVTEQQAFVQPGTDNYRQVGGRTGWLEQSNVDLNKEMTDLIQIQRTFQLAARALSSSDQMAGLANGLRSG